MLTSILKVQKNRAVNKSNNSVELAVPKLTVTQNIFFSHDSPINIPQNSVQRRQPGEALSLAAFHHHQVSLQAT